MFFYLLFYFIYYFNLVQSIPYDLLNKRYMDFNWLEFSTTTTTILDSYAPWTTVTTSSVIPSTGTVVGFLSLPDLSNAILGSPFDDNLSLLPPIVPKMNGLPTRNNDGTFTFQFKLVHPNDSYCSKQWAVPITKRSRMVTMTWLVAVEGAYSILTPYTDTNFNTNFIIGSGPITRASASPTVSNTNGNAIQFIYPAGCDASNPSSLCTVNTVAGSIQQLQTSLNVVDNSLPLFLSVRAWQVKIRSSWFVLVPHDSYDPSYFVITRAETLGYLIFPSGQTVTCTEGFAFQTLTFTNVTSHPITFQYAKNYNHPPGIFGMLGSVYSMVDATSLQALETTNSGAEFITKEDQCTTEQTSHITPEIVHVLIVGRTDEDPWLQCYASLESAQTAAPTPYPTYYPTSEPTSDPTFKPTLSPTSEPTSFPTSNPTSSPTTTPTLYPTSHPTLNPTSNPTNSPTHNPTSSPTETCLIIHIDQ